MFALQQFNQDQLSEYGCINKYKNVSDDIESLTCPI